MCISQKQIGKSINDFRRKNLPFELWSGDINSIFKNNVIKDDLELFDLNKYDLRKKEKLNTLEEERKKKKLKYQIILSKQELEPKIQPIPIAKSEWCCKKIINPSEVEKNKEEEEKKKKIMDKIEECLIL